MEIRHRKQWLTGKMVYQVAKGGGKFRDARQGDADALQENQNLIEKYDRDLINKNSELRSQLSEALGKIREYREAFELIEPNIKQGIASGQLRGEELRAVEEALRERLADPDSAVSRGIIKAFGQTGLDSAQNTIDRMCSRPLTAKDFSNLVPHHGPGLSEAEDAMREDAWYIDIVGPGLKHPTDEPVQPLQSQNLRLILERVGNTSRIYFRVQDRFTCINKYQGIADSIEAAIECIPAEDRARIGEERRYGMGVGE